MKTAMLNLFWPIVMAALLGYMMFNIYTKIDSGFKNIDHNFSQAMAQSMAFKR